MEKQFKEYVAKTVEEAIEKGLTELGLTEETAEIVVVEEPKKKLFGSTKARVQIASKFASQSAENGAVEVESEKAGETPIKAQKGGKTNEQDGERAVAFLQDLFIKTKMNATCELKSFDERIVIHSCNFR